MEPIKTGVTIALRAIIKAITGIFIVPASILSAEVMPHWRESSVPIKIISGILVLPIYFFSQFAAPWWNDFDIIS